MIPKMTYTEAAKLSQARVRLLTASERTMHRPCACCGDLKRVREATHRSLCQRRAQSGVCNCCCEESSFVCAEHARFAEALIVQARAVIDGTMVD